MHTHPITDFDHVQTRMGEDRRRADEARLAKQIRRPDRGGLRLPRFRRRVRFPVTPQIAVLTE